MSVRLGVILALFALASGCIEERVVRNGWDDWDPKKQRANQTARDAKKPAAKPAQSDPGKGKWAISLGVSSKEDHADAAERYKKHLADSAGLTEVWVVDEGKRSQVYYGRYAAPSDPQAQSDLSKLRDLQTQNVLGPSPLLFVIVSPSHDAGTTPDYDLLTMAGVGVYSLQVAVYDEQFGKEFRKEAEAAVKAIRDEGVDAYYYHGPYRSSVTVGVFKETALKLNPRTGTFDTVDPELQRMWDKFPMHKHNGVPSKSRGRDAQGREVFIDDKSFLVEIPKE